MVSLSRKNQNKQGYVNSLHAGYYFFMHLLSSAEVKFFKKFLQQHYQSVKPFGARSGPTFCLKILWKMEHLL